MKLFPKLAVAVLFSILLVCASNADAAGRIINLDKIEHKLDITFVGNSSKASL